MSSKVYDKLKFIALFVAPIVTFVGSLVNIWGIPYGEQIVATLSAVDVLLGSIVVIAKAQYEKNIKQGLGTFGDGGDVNE